jgi:hypothetical protein
VSALREDGIAEVEQQMRQLRWTAIGLLLLSAAACESPVEPRHQERDCENARQPCDQVLTENRDRLNTPFLPNRETAVIGGTVVRR